MTTRLTASMGMTFVVLGLACARPAPPANVPASAPTPALVAAAPVATTEQRFTAKKGPVVITISDQPGPIVDSTAPPPPPGYPAPSNPYLSASCAGDALGCSEAGNLLRGARSARGFIDALRKSGFEIISN